MTFYTNSAIHMVAHGAWAQALMVMGAAELGLAQREAAQPLVEARDAGRARGLGRRVPRPRAERRGSSRARRSCTTCVGWTLIGAALLTLGARLPAALGRRCSPAFARRADRALGDALLRPRRRAGLRPPLAARGGAAPVRRLVLAGLAVRARRAGGGVGARHAAARVARLPAASSSGRRRSSRLHFDQFVELPVDRRCSTSTGRNYAGRPRVPRARRRARRVRTLPTGAYTVRWHALSADGARRLGRLDVRRARAGAAADGGLRRGRADAHRARRALAVLPRARADDRLARLPAARACAG